MSKTSLFGYGSLINSESRTRTGYSGEAIPCSVKGIQRGWNTPAPENKMTAVGLILNDQATCNGVVVEIEKAELPKFDKRESGYHRFKIDKSGIIILNNQKIPEEDIWAYIPDETDLPTLENPIAQSYVDVIISGCLDYGEDFAIQFIKTTSNWDNLWINDRKNPVYSRSMADVPLASKIDDLLKKFLPLEFSKRK